MTTDADVADGMVEALIEDVRRDRNFIKSNLSRLPDHVREYLTSDEFILTAAQQYNALDTDGNGVLTPDELFPVLEEMLGSMDWGVADWITLDHCERFADVFDDDRNGVITADEFLDFCHFLTLMAYLEAQANDEQAMDEQVEEVALEVARADMMESHMIR